MTEYLYPELLNLAIEQANVDLLVKLWSDVPDLDTQHAREIETRIIESLPYLSKYYNLPLTKNFKEFVENYDFKMALEECGEGVDFCLGYFAEKGKLNTVRLLLKHGATNLNSALRKAGEGGSIEMINLLLSSYRTLFPEHPYSVNYKGLAFGLVKSLVVNDPNIDYKLRLFERNRSVALYDAVLGRSAFIGDRKLVDLALEQGASVTLYAAIEAAGGGHEDLMYFLLGDNKSKLEDCLEEAVTYGHLDIAKKLQDKVENYENYIFYGAARSGNLELIEKHFDMKDVDLAMAKAIAAKNLASVRYLLNRGVELRGISRDMLARTGDIKFFELIKLPKNTEWSLFQIKAATLGKLSIFKYVIEQGVSINFVATRTVVKNGFKDVLEFLFENDDTMKLPDILKQLKKLARENEQYAILEYLNSL